MFMFFLFQQTCLSEGRRAEVGFPTADQGFSSIQSTLFGFYGIQIVFDDCNIYPHQAWTNANDKMTGKYYIFFYKTCIEKNTQIQTVQSGGSQQEGAGSQV